MQNFTSLHEETCLCLRKNEAEPRKKYNLHLFFEEKNLINPAQVLVEKIQKTHHDFVEKYQKPVMMFL